MIVVHKGTTANSSSLLKGFSADLRNPESSEILLRNLSRRKLHCNHGFEQEGLYYDAF